MYDVTLSTAQNHAALAMIVGPIVILVVAFVATYIQDKNEK